MLSTPRWAMAAALDHLDTAHGGIESYLVTYGGLTSDVLRELTARLTDRRRVT